jgi:hypothetical protein
VAADETSQTGQARASLRELHRQLSASGAEPGSGEYARLAEDILDVTERLLGAEAADAADAAERHGAARAHFIRAVGAVTVCPQCPAAAERGRRGPHPARGRRPAPPRVRPCHHGRRPRPVGPARRRAGHHQQRGGTPRLLPVWFTTSVGYEPPSRGTDSWLDAAAGLLAYRLTYGITDTVNALGPPTQEAADPARARWRADLTRELERARQLT